MIPQGTRSQNPMCRDPFRTWTLLVPVALVLAMGCDSGSSKDSEDPVPGPEVASPEESTQPASPAGGPGNPTGQTRPEAAYEGGASAAFNALHRCINQKVAADTVEANLYWLGQVSEKMVSRVNRSYSEEPQRQRKMIADDNDCA